MTGVLACPGSQGCPDSLLGQLFRCAAVPLSNPVPTSLKRSDRWDSWTALNKTQTEDGQGVIWSPDGQITEERHSASGHASDRLVVDEYAGGSL